MSRLALLFAVVGLFSAAWSTDPGLQAPLRPASTGPTIQPQSPLERPSDEDSPVDRPLAEHGPQCTWVFAGPPAPGAVSQTCRSRHPALRLSATVTRR